MGIGWQQLLIVLVIVALIFGTKRLKGMGSDLGSALKGFRKAVSDADEADSNTQQKLSEPDAEFDEAKDATEHKETDRNHSS